MTSIIYNNIQQRPTSLHKTRDILYSKPKIIQYFVQSSNDKKLTHK